MKETIPFVKEINFKDNISTITSISLEHQESIKEGEINGEFIIFGDYKKHIDTTEKELFKYRLPFTTIIDDDINPDTIKIDIEDFTYDILDESIMKVHIDYVVTGEKKEKIEERKIEIKEEPKEELPKIIDDYIIEMSEPEKVIEAQLETKTEEEENNEFITYHIHIVNENETIEDIINKYNTTIDNIKIYNDITNINVGDKIIIPEKI